MVNTEATITGSITSLSRGTAKAFGSNALLHMLSIGHKMIIPSRMAARIRRGWVNQRAEYLSNPPPDFVLPHDLTTFLIAAYINHSNVVTISDRRNICINPI